MCVYVSACGRRRAGFNFGTWPGALRLFRRASDISLRWFGKLLETTWGGTVENTHVGCFTGEDLQGASFQVMFNFSVQTTVTSLFFRSLSTNSDEPDTLNCTTSNTPRILCIRWTKLCVHVHRPLWNCHNVSEWSIRLFSERSDRDPAAPERWSSDDCMQLWVFTAHIISWSNHTCTC